MSDARRAIPSVERLLSSAALQPVLAREPRSRVTDILRAIQQEMRFAQQPPPSEPAWYAEQVAARIDRANELSLTSVINATGVILHTNLGRAPLAQVAIDAMIAVASGYSTLEYDIDAGARGSRYTHCAGLLESLTGAEAALVVNNNAAALVLALNTIALGRGVVISRGELVEIGDSFRISEIMDRSGASLIEVGATNRTHEKDYRAAVGRAAAVLKVHPSNYRTTGFTAEVDAKTLAGVARDAGIPLIHDLGSGLLESLDDLGLPHETTAAEAINAGADIVTMSGDKLLGGPQAGIIAGRRELIEAMKRNPLCRALRVDKLTLAALEATLQCYARGTARAELPVLRMLSMPAREVKERAAAFANALAGRGVVASVEEGESAVGGGAFPDARLATSLVAVSTSSATELESALRKRKPAVIARVANDRVVLDLRTVMPEQEADLADAIANAG